MKLTQAMKIQKFQDKFDINKDSLQPPATQTELGIILRECIGEEDTILSKKEHKENRSGMQSYYSWCSGHKPRQWTL